MKHIMHIFTLVLLLALTGCMTCHDRGGVPHPSEAQVRQRLAEVVVLHNTGAQVREVRFSNDGKSILVLLDLPADTKAPSPEIILKEDGFNRYKGEFFTENLQTARNTIIIDLGKR